MFKSVDLGAVLENTLHTENLLYSNHTWLSYFKYKRDYCTMTGYLAPGTARGSQTYTVPNNISINPMLALLITCIL